MTQPASLFHSTLRWFAFALATSTASLGWCQLPQIRLDGISPCGGQRGSTFDITVRGRDQIDATNLVFSHSGITAKPILEAANRYYPDPRPVPGKYRVTIDPSVPAGVYYARLYGRYGISGPRRFHVGEFPETKEVAENHSPDKAQTLELETLVNGLTDVDSVDFFRLSLQQGESIVLHCWSRCLDSHADVTLSLCDSRGTPLIVRTSQLRRDPLLAFVAPASGDYIVRVHDTTFMGSDDHVYRLAASRRPHVEFVFPPAGIPGTTGDFTLFGYNLPGAEFAQAHGTQQLPLGKKNVQIAVPLARDSTTPMYPAMVEPNGISVAGFEYQFSANGVNANPIWIALADAPLTLEQEPNDSVEHSQSITVPGEYVGQFHSRHDIDWITFSAKKGQVLVLDLFSQRLGVPTDVSFTVQRKKNSAPANGAYEDIVDSDDSPPLTGVPGYEHTENDPSYSLTVDEDSNYRVMIRNLRGSTRDDPSLTYRLVIRPAQPDFQLLYAPRSPYDNERKIPSRWGTLLRPGDTSQLMIAAVRRDGFNGPITVIAQNLPPGVHQAVETVIPGSQTEARLLLATDSDAKPWQGSITVTGRATIADREIEHTAMSSELSWDAVEDYYSVAQVTSELMLTVTDEPRPLRLAFEKTKLGPLAPGMVVEVPWSFSISKEYKEKMGAEAFGLPDGISAELTFDEQKRNGKLIVKATTKAKPGEYQFWLAGKPEINYQTNLHAVAKAEQDRVRIAALAEQSRAAYAALRASHDAQVNQPTSANSVTEDQLAQAEAEDKEAMEALQKATEVAKTLADAAAPAERRCYFTTEVLTVVVTDNNSTPTP